MKNYKKIILLLTLLISVTSYSQNFRSCPVTYSMTQGVTHFSSSTATNECVDVKYVVNYTYNGVSNAVASSEVNIAVGSAMLFVVDVPVGAVVNSETLVFTTFYSTVVHDLGAIIESNYNYFHHCSNTISDWLNVGAEVGNNTIFIFADNP